MEEEKSFAQETIEVLIATAVDFFVIAVVGIIIIMIIGAIFNQF